jgi:hypothetical protein
MGLTELPGLKGDGPVTVFYASDSPAAPVARGPFNPSLALNGRAVAGNRRLIVLSHGSGGAPWVHTDLAQALVDVGFVVALPEHRGDNYKDTSAPGPDSWKQRPAEVSRAIDALARDARFRTPAGPEQGGGRGPVRRRPRGAEPGRRPLVILRAFCGTARPTSPRTSMHASARSPC